MRLLLLIVFCGQVLGVNAQMHDSVINASFKEFTNYIETIDNKIIVDVRPAEEVLCSGFKDALFAPTKKKLMEIINETDNTTTVLIYCTEGVRSISACNLFIENKFEMVINLNSGIKNHKKKIQSFNNTID